MDESVYMINLGESYEKPRNKRGKRAMKIIREFIARHSKTPLENVRLSNSLNSKVWERGIQKPPRRVKVKAVKAEGKTYVYHIDEKIESPKAEKKAEKKEEKPKEEPVKGEKTEGATKKEAKPTAKSKRKLSDKEKKTLASAKQADN